MPRYGTTIYDEQGNAIGRACSSSPPSGYCKECRRPSTALCDFPLSGASKGKTCDVKLCDRCKRRVRPGELAKLKASGIAISSPDAVDLCLAHARACGLS